jgi:hypothetical protein
LIGVALLLMLAIGVPVFAVVALAALNGFLAAELEPALLIIGFLDLGDRFQLLAVTLMSFIAVVLGREYWRQWVQSIPLLAGGGGCQSNRVSIAGALLFAFLAGCAVAVLMIVPSVLYSVISEVAVPRHSVRAEELLGAALVPVVLMMVLMVVLVVCMPSLVRHLNLVFGSGSKCVQRSSPLVWDLIVASVALGTIVAAGWQSSTSHWSV